MCAFIHSLIYAFINRALGAVVSHSSQGTPWLTEATRGEDIRLPDTNRSPRALSVDTSKCGGFMEIGQADRFNHRGVLWRQKI